MFKVTVLGFREETRTEEIDQVRVYELELPTEASVHDWFRDLCESEIFPDPYTGFTPCILDKIDFVEV